MNNLPPEVLLNVFFQLPQFDLRQCQLTSKKWYMTATQALYSKVEIINDNQCRSYINRIRKSPELGRYLKSLDAKNQFFGYHPYLRRLFKYRLLSTISDHCPNITSIIAESSDDLFWTQLYDTINQGRMKNIQYLPRPFYDSSEIYLETSLLLRKNLKELTLFDYEGFINSQGIYQRVQPFIEDFLKLKHLEILANQNRKITHLNTIIQDFRHINSLTINPSYYYQYARNTVQEEPVISNISSCNIRGLECNWKAINSDNQLIYVMQMFPNLYYLKTLCERDFSIYPSSISAGVLVQFVSYISKISKFKVQYIVPAATSIDSLIGFMKMDCRNRDVYLKCAYRDTSYVELTNHQIAIIFPDYAIHRYLRILHEAGNLIRSLQIDIRKVTETWQESKTRRSKEFQDVRQILQLCPSLEDLKFRCIKAVLKTQDIDFKHLKLRSISICAKRLNDQLGFVKRAGFNLPNLKHIYLDDTLDSQNITTKRYIFIDVPYTKLDLLEWSGYSGLALLDKKQWCCYINLNINSKKKIFIANENGLSMIDEEKYLLSQSERPRQVHFMITCQDLNQLKVSFSYYDEGSIKKMNWCFKNF